MTLSWIFVAGGAGAMCRFVADGLLRARFGRVFPWATIVINVSGSLLLGLLAGLALHHHLSPDAKLVWGTGFCGGFTTFSTASFEVARLIEEGRWRAATGYTLLSMAAGLGLCALGYALA